MKSLLYRITQLSLLLLITTYSSAQSTSFLLPVEVLGQEGLVVSRTLELDATTPSSATGLWLMVNNLGYENKASIRVNGGNWKTLNHSTTVIQSQELARGGMAHGGFNTIRLTVPITGFTAGTNTIDFRFDLSDGISMGYRVIRLNLVDANENKLLAGSLFTEENPDNWTAPQGYENQTAIDEGEQLWNNAPLWSNYLPTGRKGFWYGQELPGSRPINAKCSSCHAQDGRDLEIFSYSNHSIIERSKFHNLSEMDGKKIAAYIRSLSDEDNVGRHGRPWNPPYQPGPELKDKPIDQWAAGAGIDAVLDHDADMLSYLFPNGTDRDDIRNAFDADVMDDRTLLPLAIQFPDWKHWLPLIHPMDAYNKNDWWSTSLPDNKNPIKAYEAVRAWFENNFDPNNFPSGNTVAQKFRELWTGSDGNGGFRKFHEFNTNGCSNNHWRTQCGEANANLSDGIPQEFANMSLARLLAVKNFELMNEFDLQDKQRYVVPDVMADQPGPRQWPSNTYSVFEVPPHFTAISSRYYQGQDERTGHYENTTWYNVQMVLNGGNGMSGGTTPMDFNYHHPFLLFASSTSGIDEPLRYVSAVNHMYQLRTWSQSTQPSNAGFRIRFMGPWTMMGTSDSNQEFFQPSYSIIKQLDNIESGLADKILEAMLLMFLDEAESYDAGTWPRESPHGRNFALDPISKTTNDLISIPHTGTPTSGRVTEHFADKMYDIIPRIQQNFNVHCSITNRMAQWSKAVWPNIDFEKYIENCSDETCNSITPTSGLTYRIRTTHNKCMSTLDYTGNAITQQACDYEDDKRWKLEDAGSGAFYLKNTETNNYLQSPDASNGSALIESSFGAQANQQWAITAEPNCSFRITSVPNNQCIDLKSGSSDNGTRIQQYACDPMNDNRRFVLEQMTDKHELSVSIDVQSNGEEGTQDLEFVVSLDEGAINETGLPVTGSISYAGTAVADQDFSAVYQFQIGIGASQTTFTLSVSDDDAVEGTESLTATLQNVQNADLGQNKSAIASILDNDVCPTLNTNGASYLIKTAHDKCLSTTGSSSVTQQTCSGSQDEVWTIENATNNYVFLKNTSTANYLSAPALTNGTPLVVSTFDGSQEQQWLFSQKPNCSFEITSRVSDKCMDLKSGLAADGTVIQQWECIPDQNAVNREYRLENLLITSTEEKASQRDEILIFPNPTNGNINIHLPESFTSGSVSICAPNGRLISTSAFDQPQISLDSSPLASGVYHLQIQTGSQIFHKPFMKF